MMNVKGKWIIMIEENKQKIQIEVKKIQIRMFQILFWKICIR